MKWRIVCTKHAQKDARKVLTAGFRQNLVRVTEILERDPFLSPSSYEKLAGNLVGAYSRRITFQHRLVYQVFEEKRIVKIIRIWTHYG